MKNIRYFELNNGVIHSYFPENETSTIGSWLIKVDGDKISVKDIGDFSLHNKLGEIIKGRKNNDHIFAFIDDNGVIQNVSKDGKSHSVEEWSDREVKFIDQVDDGFPPYKEIVFIDPKGELPDEYGFVAWDIVKLAEELDNNT